MFSYAKYREICAAIKRYKKKKKNFCKKVKQPADVSTNEDVTNKVLWYGLGT